MYDMQILHAGGIPMFRGTYLVVFMMDFTDADMKFRPHFNDDEEEEDDKSRLSMAVSHSLGFV